MVVGAPDPAAILVLPQEDGDVGLWAFTEERGVPVGPPVEAGGAPGVLLVGACVLEGEPFLASLDDPADGCHRARDEQLVLGMVVLVVLAPRVQRGGVGVVGGLEVPPQ